MADEDHPHGMDRREYHGPQDVIGHILQLELSGASLKSRHVRESHHDLHNAGIRHFGNWGKALRAAGIDDEAVAKRRKWTVERVVKAIHRLDRQGVSLNYASVHKADGGLPQAARKLLGSWNGALRAAGYDPDAIRVSRRSWTRGEVIDLIQTRADAGLPVASYNIVPQSAEVASRRLFGSWKAALRAADVPNPSVEFPVWTKVSVVEGILMRQLAGKPLHPSAAAQQASRLYDAARRCFGSWRQALEAAGIDPETVQRRRSPWTPEEVVATLKFRAKEREDVSRPFTHPESFVKAARRLLGSWQQALRMAGIGE